MVGRLLLFHHPSIQHCLWKPLYKIPSCCCCCLLAPAPFLLEAETRYPFFSRSLACEIAGDSFCSPYWVPAWLMREWLPSSAFPYHLSSLLSPRFSSPKIHPGSVAISEKTTAPLQSKSELTHMVEVKLRSSSQKCSVKSFCRQVFSSKIVSLLACYFA